MIYYCIRWCDTKWTWSNVQLFRFYTTGWWMNENGALVGRYWVGEKGFQCIYRDRLCSKELVCSFVCLSQTAKQSNSFPVLLNTTTNKTKLYHYFPHKIFEVFMALTVNIRKYNKLFLTHKIWDPHSGVAEDSNGLGMLLCVMAQTFPHFLKKL